MDRIVSRQTNAAGEPREYVSHLVRRTFREDGKVKNETIANVSHLPPAAIDVLRKALAGRTLVDVEKDVEIARSLQHGNVAAVMTVARQLGLPALLGPAGRQRDIALALIVARIIQPGSKLATRSWWSDNTLGADLGIDTASTDEIYAAMDWLLHRQDDIERQLVGRHLVDGGQVLFDLSSSWMEGHCCPLASHGYSRDGRRGLEQIEYGVLTDADGRPVAIRVFPGNTGDPSAFIEAVHAVQKTFHLKSVIMVGDRGMITSARIRALRESDDLGWITALRAPQIAQLAAVDGPLQPTLFDETNLAEIRHPKFPGERLIACRNPFLAAERARKRDELLDATEKALAPVVAAVTEGRIVGAADIGMKIGKIVHRRKMAKHLEITITDADVTIARREESIAAEAALDGIYVVRAEEKHASGMRGDEIVTAYKNLSQVERVFRTIKTTDLQVRPIYHYLENRVRAHLLICSLAAYITWHLRKRLAPLTFTDEEPPGRTDPVAPALRSEAANRKSTRKEQPDGTPLYSFQGLLAHLATLTRDEIRISGGGSLQLLTNATETQRKVFQLIGAPISKTVGSQ
ncbi:IS1634 family transposase [Pseudofrankia sp. BMG5.37]|nr:IS1634 family transposase [Pseudofrankia sp. BMG5.37]MDT3440231.1 IS1634 family transposase [Pseudofrankia sp. BMG5.37]MDT3440575.1 IS1634 family transposase [Pseudofrankia sp. BMG5.37]MDT3443920.1 IS1634 family transposase [Pseudofrankia sp. BMG5.37]MDT3444187.1 IS1634 family transposase [Pseudofrankia sp. BMG5.37]MDT3444964.1 IS1634 family transposase [Pseudofrankia sp. BMG5.37]